MGSARRAVLALTFFTLAACRPSSTVDKSPKSALPSERQSELKMSAMHIQSYGDNGLEWEMTAPFGEMFTRKNVMRVRNMNVQMYENGQKSTLITADQGLFSTGARPDGAVVVTQDLFGVQLSSGDMYLNGNVVMVSTDGSKMTTDWAHYHHKTDLITSTAPVRVDRQDSTTRGIGMEATADMTRVHIFNETLTIPDRGVEEKK